ncbi:hypothetical protein [Aureibacillus halotolerans]|uniref:Uncharacterized protein n=1 Tax=Aureibacillus halotolerans TaxID=1508390 RepID=A0A4R6TZ90_9BACI|nr:hypothetical protein [Aureibacillus halotolerans]TDQ38666.1 hypothetical protein EV213_10934 [Aureibacillus halotolerans]
MFRNIVRRFFGFILAYIGLSIVLATTSTAQMLLGPIFLAGFGWVLYEQRSIWLRYLAYIHYTLALVTFCSFFLPPDFVYIVLGGAFLYLGFCILTGKSFEYYLKPPSKKSDDEILDALCEEEITK